MVFGKDDARQVTAMFSTEQEAKALAADLMQFARGQSVLVAPFSGEDQARIAALNAGERAMQPAADAPLGGAGAAPSAHRGGARLVVGAGRRLVGRSRPRRCAGSAARAAPRPRRAPASAASARHR